MNLEEMKREIERIARSRGWSDSVTDKLVWVLTELGEASNAWKRNRSQTVKARELADVIIGTLDLSRVLCPGINMDYVVAQKLRSLERTERVSSDYLVVDVSAFLSEKRFAFLLELLEEKELSPERVVLANELYSILSGFAFGERKPSDENLLPLREIVTSWEKLDANKIMSWMSSEKFSSLLRIFFEKWNPLPAGELVGYDRSKNPIDAEEFRKKLGKAGELLYDELKTAQKTRSCIVCLSRALARLLVRMRHVLIEIPHTKKKMWMEKHNWFGGLIFFIVTDVAARNISAPDLERLLSEIAQHASPIVRNLFVDIDIPSLAHSIFNLFAPTVVAAVLGVTSVAIAFDSISYPKIVMGH
jgi:NTP pyrophosphatase (non-canonical NTP hydrolase)